MWIQVCGAGTPAALGQCTLFWQGLHVLFPCPDGAFLTTALVCCHPPCQRWLAWRGLACDRHRHAFPRLPLFFATAVSFCLCCTAASAKNPSKESGGAPPSLQLQQLRGGTLPQRGAAPRRHFSQPFAWHHHGSANPGAASSTNRRDRQL